jgi:hypothetical protein
MGQEKLTGEIKNKHKISVGNVQRKRHLHAYCSRWNVRDNVMNYT